MKLRSGVRGALIAVMTVVLSMTAVPAATAATYDTTPVPTGIPNGRVYAIATDEARVYIGGTFTRINRTPRAGLAAFDAVTGALDTSWNPGINGRVRALTVENGVLYVGGSFTTDGGATTVNVAAFDTATGQPVPGFSSITTNGEVRDLTVAGAGDLYLAGSFTTVNGRTRVSLAKVNRLTGVLDTGFNARVGSGRAIALAEDPARGQLLIGGNFKTLAGASQYFLGAVDYATGARKTGWVPPRVCDTCNVLDLDSDGLDDGRYVYAATAGGGGGRAVAYDVNGNRRWVKLGDGDVQAVDYYDGTVYIGGHFGVDLDGFVRHQVAALDPLNGTVQGFAIPFTGSDDPGVWALKADESFLRVGGGFQGISGVSAARYAIFPAMTQSSTP